MKIWTILGGIAVVAGLSTLAFRDMQHRDELTKLAATLQSIDGRMAARAASTNGPHANGVAEESPQVSSATGSFAAREAAPSIARADSVTPTTSADGARSKPPITEDDMRTRLEVALATGAGDPGWTRTLRQDVSDKLRVRANSTDSTLRQVDCREAICRVEIEHGSRADYDRFVRESVIDLAAPVWSTPSFTSIVPSPSGGGRVLSISYISRQNSELPVVD
jgi:hypothetical protein